MRSVYILHLFFCTSRWRGSRRFGCIIPRHSIPPFPLHAIVLPAQSVSFLFSPICPQCARAVAWGRGCRRRGAKSTYWGPSYHPPSTGIKRREERGKNESTQATRRSKGDQPPLANFPTLVTHALGPVLRGRPWWRCRRSSYEEPRISRALLPVRQWYSEPPPAFPPTCACSQKERRTALSSVPMAIS